MQFSTTVTFTAADEAAALAEVESWQLSPGVTVHALVGLAPVDGMPATVGEDGALTLAAPPDPEA